MSNTLNPNPTDLLYRTVDAATSIKPAVEELERAFLYFSSELWFKPRRILLPLPVITLHTRGRRAAYGWFAKKKWQGVNGGRKAWRLAGASSAE